MELRSGRTKKEYEDDVVDDYCREYAVKPGERDQLKTLIRRSRWWVSLREQFKNDWTTYLVFAVVFFLIALLARVVFFRPAVVCKQCAASGCLDGQRE